MENKIYSSDSSGEGGNTKLPPKKQIPPSIRWIFVLNNWTEEEYNNIKNVIVPKFCKYAVIGKEVGKCGTPHLQGYIELITKGRPISVFNNERIHFEKARGKKEHNQIYNSKDLNYWEYDKFKPRDIKVISEEQFYCWQYEIMNILKNEPDERKIYWFWSEKGGTGKTSFQKYLAVKHNALILGGKAADIRNAICEYKKAKGDTPELICVNIPRSFNKEYVSYEGFENIKDMCFYSGKYEGGMVVGNCPHLLIFANIAPDEEKMSDDRFIIFNID